MAEARSGRRDAGAHAWRPHPIQAARDRQIIDRALGGHGLVYDHRPAPSEPLLWAVDAIVWAVGAGRDWRRRVDHRVEVRQVGA